MSIKIEIEGGHYEHGFTQGNTEGYTDLQLDAMNRQLAAALPAQPVDPDVYQHHCEAIEKSFLMEC